MTQLNDITSLEVNELFLLQQLYSKFLYRSSCHSQWKLSQVFAGTGQLFNQTKISVQFLFKELWSIKWIRFGRLLTIEKKLFCRIILLGGKQPLSSKLSLISGTWSRLVEIRKWYEYPIPEEVGQQAAKQHG